MNFVRFQVSMAASMKIRAFWDILSCGLVGVDRREAVRSSETSVYYNETKRRSIPEGSDLLSEF
jgi:hypothetical protein